MGLDLQACEAGLHQLRQAGFLGKTADGRYQLMDLISKRIRAIGSQQNHREFLYEALDLTARGKVKVLTEIYPLAEIGKAYDRVEQGQARFRAVITP